MMKCTVCLMNMLSGESRSDVQQVSVLYIGYINYYGSKFQQARRTSEMEFSHGPAQNPLASGQRDSGYVEPWDSVMKRDEAHIC